MGESRAGIRGRSADTGKRLLEKDGPRSPVNEGIWDGLLAKELCKRHTKEAVDDRRRHSVSNEPKGGIPAAGPHKTV